MITSRGYYQRTMTILTIRFKGARKVVFKVCDQTLYKEITGPQVMQTYYRNDYTRCLRRLLAQDFMPKYTV